MPKKLFLEHGKIVGRPWNPEPRAFMFRQETKLKAKGRVKVMVVEDGEVIDERPWQDNLILNQGLDKLNTMTWRDVTKFGHAGTGTTLPTLNLLDGTYSQTGTTVTKQTGSGSFAANPAEVGKILKFTDGTLARIVSRTSASTVTVAESQTVATQTVVGMYHVTQTHLQTWAKSSNNYPNYTNADGTKSQDFFYSVPDGTVTFRRTYDFVAETGSVNYSEVGVAEIGDNGNNLFARVVLAGAVSVTSGQQLRMVYELKVTVVNHDQPGNIVMPIAGWPVVYNIASIVAGSGLFTVNTTAPHHYIGGGKVNVASAIRPKITITAVSGSGTTFTVTTATAHGLSSGNSVVIEGVTPSGYNGTWTILGTTSTTFTVTSAVTGAGTVFGTVRLANPGSWYSDAEWTIATVPTSTSFTVNSAPAPGIDAGPGGNVQNNLKAKYCAIHPGIVQLTDQVATDGSVIAWKAEYWLTHPVGQTNGGNIGINEPSGQFLYCSVVPGDQVPPGYGIGEPWYPDGRDWEEVSTSGNVIQGVKAAYVAGNYYQDYTFTFAPGMANYNNIYVFALQTQLSNENGQDTVNVQFAVRFQEAQLKSPLSKLVLIFRRSWSRDLS